MTPCACGCTVSERMAARTKTLTTLRTLRRLLEEDVEMFEYTAQERRTTNWNRGLAVAAHAYIDVCNAIDSAESEE